MQLDGSCIYHVSKYYIVITLQTVNEKKIIHSENHIFENILST